MALDYDIGDNSGNYFEFRLPVANYNTVEGNFLNATSYESWQGFNGEQYSWRREDENVSLYNEDSQELIQSIPLEHYENYLDTLSLYESELEFAQTIIDILKSITKKEDEIVTITYG